jgi:hypothetical protein
LQLQDDKNKDDDNDWVQQEPVGVNWEVDVEALVVNDGEGGYTVDELIIGNEYDVKFSRTLGTMNRTTTNSRVNMTGTAILSDLTINAQVGNIATYTAKLTGNGELYQES